MRTPRIGSSIQIQSYKHDGSIHRVWERTTVLKVTDKEFIGANNRTLVRESDGRTWLTREPAICYFNKDLWFNLIGMIRSNGIYYYCNLSSPYLIDWEALKYIDYDLDIKVSPDFSYQVLDEDEYLYHRRLMNYPDEIHSIVQKQLTELRQMIEKREGPFHPDFVDSWYKQFNQK